LAARLFDRGIYSLELLFAAPESPLLEDEPADEDELESEVEDEDDAEAAGAACLLSLLVSLSVLTGAGLAAPDFDLLSVAYQPEPLKIIPDGVITLRSLFLLHSGQRVNAWSLNDCWRSKRTPQFSQRYV
jgi:hypothetical protein